MEQPQFFVSMAKTRQQKEETIAQLVDHIKNAKSVVLANFQGLTVSDTDALRSECRTAGITCVASKKTLVKRALSDAGLTVDTKAFKGSIAVFASTEDEVAPAQIVAKFAKDHELVTFFGGVLESAFISAEEVAALSKLPSKQQLLGQLVGTLNAPVSGFVNVLAGNLRGLVTVLNAVKDQKTA